MAGAGRAPTLSSPHNLYNTAHQEDPVADCAHPRLRSSIVALDYWQDARQSPAQIICEAGCQTIEYNAAAGCSAQIFMHGEPDTEPEFEGFR